MLKLAGVIAEYNPLHNGHMYHLNKAKKLTQCDYLIVVLSGSFVQRGEPAMFDKWRRTYWALQAGADMVLELPTVFALSSAERFAIGGVRILTGTGLLTHLCFGSENGNVDLLRQAASLHDCEPEAYSAAIKMGLEEGKSYPRARFEAASKINLSPELIETINRPNDILGIEYIRALNRYAPDAEPVAIVRKGPQHDSKEMENGFASASEIRRMLAVYGTTSADEYLPSFVADEIIPLFESGLAPVLQNNFSDLIIYCLRRMSLKEISEIPDINEGLENLIYKSVRNCSSYDRLLELVKTKRYTMARLKRSCMCALLGISNKLQQYALNPESGLYLRVLGFRRTARTLLSLMQQQAEFPVLIRYGDLNQLSGTARMIHDIDILASDIHALGMPAGLPAGRDYTEPIIIY